MRTIRFKTIIANIVFFFLVVGLAPAMAWNSVFLAPSGPNWVAQTVTIGGRAFKLDDYSYCGYKLSTVGVADSIPCNHVTVGSSGDITTAMRNAVANLKTLGGGYVHIPAGTVTLSGTVTITGANIDIVGAGSGATTVVIASSYNPSDQLTEAPFTFMGGGGTGYCQWPEPGKGSSKTSCSNVARGDQSVTVGSNTGLAVGNWVVVQQYFWANFVSINSANNWTTNPPGTGTDSAYQQTFCFPRKITAIAGNVITLDAPIPWTMNNANAAVTFYKPIASEFIENDGIEALSIKVLANTNNGGRPSGTALAFKAVFNGWARDVKITNIAMNGIKTAWSTRITCLDCGISGAQDTGGGGWGYGYFNYASSAILYKRCSALNLRHNFTDAYAMTNMEVHTQCSSLKTIGNSASVTMENDDTHVCYAQRVLWDSHTMSNNAILEMNRETQSGNDTYETCGGTAVWNCSVTGTNSFGIYKAGTVQCSPATYTTDSDGIVTGVSAGATVYDGAEDMDAGWITGTKMTGAATQVGPRGNVAYEGLNVTGLSPSSLFDAQLQSRLGSLPPDSAPSTCFGATSTPTNTATTTPSATATSTATTTATQTATKTATFTATMTATFTPTNTATKTSTNTPGNTSTSTSTSTATSTYTNTASATATKTATNTATNTIPNTSTNTATATSTNTPTRTATMTATATPTNTMGNTATSTSTSSATNTATTTATKTATNTMGSTATNTMTATPTSTATDTATKTSTASPTQTATKTATSTSTNSATSTSTNTQANSATSTATKTSTSTATSTATASATKTPTNTATSTSSNTPTNSPTITSTNTTTNTATNTATGTTVPTNTFTTTSTNTSTSTATNTATHTPTMTASNTATSTTTSTTTYTPTSTSSDTATSTSTNTSANSPTNTATNTSTNTSGNTATKTATATATSSATASMTPTASLTASPSATPTATSTATSTSTNTGVNTATNTATSTATKAATKTATNTSTNTTGNTATRTATSTTTSTPTNTPTSTASPTATTTTVDTATTTATSTPKHRKKGGTLYPNPATGNSVDLLTDLETTSDMTVSVFTIAFRKVQETSYSQVPSGGSITLDLRDTHGALLANGIYYVAIEVQGERFITKLLVLR